MFKLHTNISSFIFLFFFSLNISILTIYFLIHLWDFFANLYLGSLSYYIWIMNFEVELIQNFNFEISNISLFMLTRKVIKKSSGILGLDFKASKFKVQSLWSNASFINSTNISTIVIPLINLPLLPSWEKLHICFRHPNFLKCQTLSLYFSLIL